MEKRHEFVTLDALRGAAAVAVMEFHTFRFFGYQIFPHGYLAVDFFFMLSGFVLSFAYQAKLDQGWSTTSFLKARLIRLYPLYFLGLVGGSLFFVLQDRFGKVHASNSAFLVLFALGSVLLPNPSFDKAGGGLAFPLNVPAWSLFYEAIANVLHALCFRRRRTRVLAIATLVSGGIFAAFSMRLGSTNSGVYSSEIVYGVSRVLFSYLAGSLLFRIWQSGKLRVRVPALVTIVGLLVVLMLPVRGESGTAVDLILIIGLFPVLLLAGASAGLPSWFASTGKLLGAASYAIYVLHVPLAEFFEQVWIRVRGHRIEADAPWAGIVCIVLTILVTVVIDRVYDLPVRNFLRRRLASTPRKPFVRDKEERDKVWQS